MNNRIRAIDTIHADRAARFEGEARRRRIAAQAGVARRAVVADERRIRRAVGGAIVRVGARIAADPAADSLQPAGSR
jgi:hypothetical protein